MTHSYIYTSIHPGSGGDIFCVDLVAPVASSTGTPALPAAQQYVGHTAAVASLSLSFDGTMLVSGSRDGTVKVLFCVCMCMCVWMHALDGSMSVAGSRDGVDLCACAYSCI
jgi:hypothetical protein